jgi:hypothetical protein
MCKPCWYHRGFIVAAEQQTPRETWGGRNPRTDRRSTHDESYGTHQQVIHCQVARFENPITTIPAMYVVHSHSYSHHNHPVHTWN